mmetsp:Transcript_14146/g.42789  ORF Transcript_14146/g.42789 Transcript_14146/m.42789 type:complete len:312 (-) Transcript_14146:196-1131(-)
MLLQFARALVRQRVREVVREWRDGEAVVGGDGLEVDVVRGPELGHRGFRSHGARARSDVEDALDEDVTVAVLLPDDNDHRKESSGAAPFVDLDANDAAEIVPRRHQLVDVFRELQRITVRHLDLDHDVRFGIVAQCNSKDDVGIASFLREDLVVVVVADTNLVDFPMAAAGPEFGSQLGVHGVRVDSKLFEELCRRSLVAFVRNFANNCVPRFDDVVPHELDAPRSDFRIGVRVLDSAKEQVLVVAVFVELFHRLLIVLQERRLLPFFGVRREIFFFGRRPFDHSHGRREKLLCTRSAALDRTRCPKRRRG